MERQLATLIATGFGSGRARLLPGTAGSLAALATWWLIGTLLTVSGPAVAAVGAVCSTLLGFWATSRYLEAKRAGALSVGAGHPTNHRREADDPAEVVIDEWAGMFLTLLLTQTSSLTEALAGFLIFRVLDMSKPWVIGWCERLPGAAGIMADDLAAGACSFLLLQLVVVRWFL
jgi:phosphatidylglycerophosphatase A